MSDKSPRQAMSKKSSKTLKQKRTERKAKADPYSAMDKLTEHKKH